MNLWTPTPQFPVEGFSDLETSFFCVLGEEHDRLHSTYLPMASSMRHSSSCVFAALHASCMFQWKSRGVSPSLLFQWNHIQHSSIGEEFSKISEASMNQNTIVAFMPSTGHLLQVDNDRCYGCAACIMVCPVDALRLHGWLVEVDHATCTLCDHCLPSCPVDALAMELSP